MPDIAEPAVCRFNDFLLDKREGLFRLHPDGRKTPVKIGSRALRDPRLLVDRRGEIVSQREIMDAVWPNVAVEPNNLTVQIAALRRALDADRGHGSCIQNIPGRGYRFVPTVTETRSATRLSGTRARQPRSISRPPDLDMCREPEPSPAPAPAARLRTAGQGPGASLGPPLRASPSRFWRRPLSGIRAACCHPRSGKLPHTPHPQPPIVAPTERPRLSLVVLPFLNLGGEGLDDAGVDAVTEEVTAEIRTLCPASGDCAQLSVQV